MKKLMFAALVAGSLSVFAAEAPKTEAAPAAKPVETVKAAKARPQMTDEMRAQMKARREKFMAERKARQEKARAQMLETVKKYIPDEAKAKALLDELEKDMRMAFRPTPPMRRAGRPGVKPAAPAAK